MKTPLLTVIMPVYNAEKSVTNAISSILNTSRKQEIEIVVVDDCSSDSTVAIVEKLREENENIKLLTMQNNSGGPSAPRNLAIENASGEFITFVDEDDRVDSAIMMKMMDFAISKNHDIVKGYLYNVSGSTKTIANRLHEIPVTTKQAITNMVSFQSTTCDFFVKRSILLENEIRYHTDIKIGEDTVFFFDALTHAKSVGYIDTSHYMYHTTSSLEPLNPSSTQQCGDREINHQITAWERSQEIMQKININYYKLRLHVGFRNLLISIVRFSDGISKETYNRLHTFAVSTKSQISGKMSLHNRYEELYGSILSGDYYLYLQTAKLRILINGYDLKFALPIVPYLQHQYTVQVDEWTGHNAHDKKQSEQLLDWADIIWCEWLLGNAQYYSQRINTNQRAIVRCHGFEVERDFGNQVDVSKTHLFFMVSYFYFELFSKTFSLPREKMRLLPNYVEEDIYITEKSENAKFHIGLVGSLPKRKGLHEALKLLLVLKQKEPRFKLYVMGQQAKDVPWIRNNPTEFEYYESCDSYISENNLANSVIYGGYVERSKLYKEIGYVLSLSDDEDRPESFHLAPAEGACAGSMGLLLNWCGVEYVYPKEIIFSSIDDMADEILKACGDNDYFDKKSRLLRDYILECYSMDKFMSNLNGYINQLFLI